MPLPDLADWFPDFRIGDEQATQGRSLNRASSVRLQFIGSLIKEE
jgi:hypothetical protein